MKTQTENQQAAGKKAACLQTENMQAANKHAASMRAADTRTACLPETKLKADHWLTAIDSDRRLQKTLSCFLPRGIATWNEVENLSGISQHPVRDALKTLSEPPGGLRPLIKPLNVSLPGRRGRPQAAFYLTQEGASAFDCPVRSAPNLSNPIEAAHALMEMQVYTAVFQANKSAAVEKVLFYEGTRNVRVDVLVEEKTLFEIEQCAHRKDVPRIATKLEHLQYFFSTLAAKEIDSKVRILFGISASDGKTIQLWQNVLGAVQNMKGQLNFELYWANVSDFLQCPEWENISKFQRLEPLLPEQSVSIANGSEEQEKKELILPDFVIHGRTDLEEINLVMGALESTMEPEQSESQDQRANFFEIIETIYDASHYFDGPVKKKASFPVTSLMLLYRFLHLHQNKPLLDQLQTGYKTVLSSQRKGISFFRVTLTRFYWDVFLRYFDFGRGGPLSVKVEVPSFEDDSSEIFTSVRIHDGTLVTDDILDISPDEPQHAEKALSWVLDALYLYAFDLGLMKVSPNKRGSENEAR